MHIETNLHLEFLFKGKTQVKIQLVPTQKSSRLPSTLTAVYLIRLRLVAVVKQCPSEGERGKLVMVGGTFTHQHNYGWRKSKGRSHLFPDYAHVSFLISVWILVPRSIWPPLKRQLKK